MTPAFTAYLTDIKQRRDKATPGPWTIYNSEQRSRFAENWREINPMVVVPSSFDRTVGEERETYCGVKIKGDDAAFIAHARTDVDRLLRIVELKQKALEEIGKEVDSRNDTIIARALAAVEAIAKEQP